jgi:hypothetical protein
LVVSYSKCFFHNRFLLTWSMRKFQLILHCFKRANNSFRCGYKSFSCVVFELCLWYIHNIIIVRHWFLLVPYLFFA